MSIRVRPIATLTLAVLGVALASCITTEEGPVYYSGPFAYTEVHLEPSIVKAGTTSQAHLIAFNEAGFPLGELQTTWSGDAPSHAVVDADGTIHGVAAGQVTLATAVDPTPFFWSLYVTPATTCGMVTDVSEWWLEGSFAWNDTSASADSVIRVRQTAAISLVAREPRQVNTSEIVWRFSVPRPGETFTLETHDTLRLGAATRFQRKHTSTTSPRNFTGEVTLDFSACELYTRVYPRTVDSVFLVRPGLSDSLLEANDGGWQPFGTGRIDVAGITTSAPVVLATSLPVLPPTDNDVAVGYAPTGYAAFLYAWNPAAAPIALTFTAKPSWAAIPLARRP